MKRANSKSGFTLVELLTVIAIISILMAVLFPVMKSVKDGAKRTNCQTNLHNIGIGLQQYKLDNRRCPVSLFPYYDPASPVPMRDRKGGLYGEYVKVVKGFRCPSSNPGSIDSPTIALDVVTETGAVAKKQFYQGDSYDYVEVSAGALSPSYAYMWAPAVTDVERFNPHTGQGTDTPELQQRDFARQLRFANPDSSTVVTWCMNHRGGGEKALVLFLDNSVDLVPMHRMNPNSPEPDGKVCYRILPNE